MMQVNYKRADGSFVVTLNGLPYHVVDGDPLFEQIDPTGVPDEPQPEQPTEAEQLAAWRAAATIPRDTFLQACVSGGIITQEVAEEAADGSWPAAFNTFLSGLTGAQRIQAKARWADAKDVRRNSDILALIAAYQSVSDATLDAMFGWEG